MTPEKLDEIQSRDRSLSTEDLLDFIALCEELRQAWRERDNLLDALREALDMLGPCDRSEYRRGRCTHRDGLHRLPCPVEEMRKLLEED